MNKKHTVVLIFSLFAFVVLVIFLFFSNNYKSEEGSEKISVTASFYPLYFFAGEIGGEKAQVFNITPSGSEPHDYEPTLKDIAKIANSNLLILNGGGLETWADKIKQNIDATKTVIIYAGEGLMTENVEQNANKSLDFHVWLSPTLASQMIDKILDGFVKVDPLRARYYRMNAENLKIKLDEIDKKYSQGLARCQGRSIIVSHSAFGYLASKYNFIQIPIAGLSPDAEPSPIQLVGIADFAKKNNIKIIFFERLASPKFSETVASEVGAVTKVLDPIEGIAHDDMMSGQNYFTLMENNLSNLKIALRCTQ